VVKINQDEAGADFICHCCSTGFRLLKMDFYEETTNALLTGTLLIDCTDMVCRLHTFLSRLSAPREGQEAWLPSNRMLSRIAKN